MGLPITKGARQKAGLHNRCWVGQENNRCIPMCKGGRALPGKRKKIKRSPLHYAGERLLRELLHSRHKRAHLHLWGRGGVVLEGPILIYFSGRGGVALESESISAYQAVDTLFCHSSSSAVRASGICLWE